MIGHALVKWRKKMIKTVHRYGAFEMKKQKIESERISNDNNK